jgi:hypothetical protein
VIAFTTLVGALVYLAACPLGRVAAAGLALAAAAGVTVLVL